MARYLVTGYDTRTSSDVERHVVSAVSPTAAVVAALAADPPIVPAPGDVFTVFLATTEWTVTYDATPDEALV